MERITNLWLRLKTLRRRRQLDRDLEDEMAFHLSMKEEKLRARGLSAGDAHTASRRRFGNFTRLKEDARAMWTFAPIETFWTDVRYALRMLRKTPALTAVVIVSLALGIGANSALFALMDSILLSRLPVSEPDRLVLLTWYSKAWPERVMSDLEGSSFEDEKTGIQSSYSFSSLGYEYIRDNNQVFDNTIAFTANMPSGNVGIGKTAHSVTLSAVSGNYFQGLRVAPLVGRIFAAEDDTPAASSVAIVSYRFWQQFLGGDSTVVGRNITVNGTPVSVVGVTPPEFLGVEPGSAPDLWVPLSFEIEQARRVADWDLRDPKVWHLGIIGRLKPGVTEAQARTDVNLLCNQFLQIGSPAVPRDDKAPWFGVTNFAQGVGWLRKRFTTTLFLLMGMVGVVLLIACANVAGLLLAKATSRKHEIAVRVSLGAPRLRLVRQLLTESVVLAVAGGLAGLLVAYWAHGALLAFVNSGREPLDIPAQSNASVLAFTYALSVLCGILFGLAPALRGTRSEVFSAIKQGAGHSATARSAFRTGKFLVAGQVALSLLLLISAGLLLRTLRRLEQVNLGFDRQNLVTFRVFPGLNGYKTSRLTGYYDDLRREVATLPGVRSVSMSQLGPIGSGESMTSANIPGYTNAAKGVRIWQHRIASGYFDTLGVPILLGRSIDDRDTPTSPLVAVVNQRFVRDYLHGDNPVGHQIVFDSKSKKKSLEIIGVAGDMKYNRVREDAPPAMYLPYGQQLSNAIFMTYLVRTSGDPRQLIGPIQKAALKVSKDVPVVALKTETELIDQVLVEDRTFATLSSAFGVLALLLACIGLYGTIAYIVARRTNEIGIRMALGATREAIVAMVVREILVVVGAGIAVGLPLAWFATQVLKTRLFGLSPHDAATIFFSTAAILLVTLAAGFHPARRAARVDPMVALRYE